MKRTSTRFLGLAITAAVAIFSAAATHDGLAADKSDPAIPVIVMQAVPLVDAMKNLAQQSGLNFILDPKLLEPGTPGTSVTFRWENMTAQAALARLLREHNLFLVENPATTVARITVTNQTANPVDPAWIAGDTNGVIPLIQMEFVPLDVAIKQLAATARLDMMLDMGAANSSAPQGAFSSAPMISIRWKKVTARQAIAALCENYDLVLSTDAATGIVRISTAAHRQALKRKH